MRFRKGKDGGEGGSPPPPDASTRVENPTEVMTAPPPAGTDRVDDPTTVQPTREAEGPAKVLPPGEGERAEPSGGGPSTADTAETPALTGVERAKDPAPSADQRVESPAKVLPPPSIADRVSAPPPSAAARVDAPAGAPPPQPGQLVSAAPPAASATTACPQCGTPAEAGQEMCIVCGSRIARDRSRSRGWLVPALLAGLGVLLLGTAVAFGVVELTSDDEVKKNDVADLNESQPTTPPATPPPATPPTDTAPTIPPASGDTQPTDPSAPPSTPDTPPDTTTPAPTTPDTGGEIAEWPSGKTAYTVVLVSATSRNAADAKAEQAIKRGIKAGVLRSDDFSTLREGYWVVFAGQFDSSEQATRAADRYAEQGFGGGYPRQVKPK